MNNKFYLEARYDTIVESLKRGDSAYKRLSDSIIGGKKESKKDAVMSADEIRIASMAKVQEGVKKRMAAMYKEEV